MGILTRFRRFINAPIPPRQPELKRRIAVAAEVREALVALPEMEKVRMLRQLDQAEERVDDLGRNVKALNPGLAHDKLAKLLADIEESLLRFRLAVRLEKRTRRIKVEERP